MLVYMCALLVYRIEVTVGELCNYVLHELLVHVNSKHTWICT